MGGPAPPAPRYLRNPKAIHHGGHQEKSQTSQVEGHGGAGPGNDVTSRRGCDDAGSLPDAGVQRHRAEHHLTVNEMRIQNLTSWCVESLNCTSAKSDDQDVPDLDSLEEGERRQ